MRHALSCYASVVLVCSLSFLICGRITSADPAHPIDEMKVKYPFGSIYLTYIPVNDMFYLLNDDQKFKQISLETAPSEKVLNILKAFVNNNRGKSMSDAIAFLQLDLNSGKAGFKRLADKDGVIQPLAWTEEEVKGIAKFCDTFLNRRIAFEKIEDSIASGKLSVSEAWENVQRVKDDPYLPKRQMALILIEFRSLIKEKPNELEKLGQKDKDTHDIIVEFTKKFDSSPESIDAKRREDERVFPDWQLQNWRERETKKDAAVIRAFEESSYTTSHPDMPTGQAPRQVSEPHEPLKKEDRPPRNP